MILLVCLIGLLYFPLCSHLQHESPRSSVSPLVYHYQINFGPCRYCHFRVQSPAFRTSRLKRCLPGRTFPQAETPFFSSYVTTVAVYYSVELSVLEGIRHRSGKRSRKCLLQARNFSSTSFKMVVSPCHERFFSRIKLNSCNNCTFGNHSHHSTRARVPRLVINKFALRDVPRLVINKFALRKHVTERTFIDD